MERPDDRTETSQEKHTRYVAIIVLCTLITFYLIFSFDSSNGTNQATSIAKITLPEQQKSKSKTITLHKKKRQDFKGIVKSNSYGDTVEVFDEEGNHIWVPKPSFPIKEGDHVTVLVDEIPGYQILPDTITSDSNTFLASVDEILSDHVILSRYELNGLVTQLAVPKPYFNIKEDSDVLIAHCQFYQYEIIEVSP